MNGICIVEIFTVEEANHRDLQALGIPKGATGLIIAAARGTGDFFFAFIFCYHPYLYALHSMSVFFADIADMTAKTMLQADTVLT